MPSTTGPKKNRMPTVGIVSQTNRLADECRGDVDRVAPPLDLTVLAHPSHLIFSAIFRLTQNAVPTPRRQIVVISWRSIPERFVRSLVIVHLLKGFEALELLVQRARRRIGRVLQERQVQ